jgi:hypothetical protein
MPHRARDARLCRCPRSLVRVSGGAHILRNVQSAKEEKDAARHYEEAEEAFLAAIRTGDGRAALTALADDVAAQAKAWNAAAYAAYHVSDGEQRSALDRSQSGLKSSNNSGSTSLGRSTDGQPFATAERPIMPRGGSSVLTVRH